MLAEAWLGERLARPVSPSEVNFGEALTYRELADAAALVGAVLERQGPGYHRYFPGQTLELAGYDAAETVAKFFPHTPLREPWEKLRALFDLSGEDQQLGILPPATPDASAVPALGLSALPGWPRAHNELKHFCTRAADF